MEGTAGVGGAPEIDRNVAAPAPPIVAESLDELGVSNNGPRMRVPQPAQNSASGGTARPHLAQKDAADVSVMGPGVSALWSVCQFAVQNVVFRATDSKRAVGPQESVQMAETDVKKREGLHGLYCSHFGHCANSRASLDYGTLK